MKRASLSEITQWFPGPQSSLPHGYSQPSPALQTVPRATFGHLRNYGNVKTGTRRTITWGEWNDFVTSKAHEELFEWKGEKKKSTYIWKLIGQQNFPQKRTHSWVYIKSLLKYVMCWDAQEVLWGWGLPSQIYPVKLRCVFLRTILH